ATATQVSAATSVPRSRSLAIRRTLSYVYVPFFFSSRRRHTRSKRDWSSDVCSSDLYGNGTSDHHMGGSAQGTPSTTTTTTPKGRSEERRVGKESRARWAPKCRKKKKQRTGRCRKDERLQNNIAT